MAWRKEKKEEFYMRKAKEEGFPARSVYKLKEIDEKFGLVKLGDKVLDLGSAPGSWLAYLSEKVGKEGRVVGIDVEDVNVNELNRGKKSNITFFKKDILTLTDEDFSIIGNSFDAVVADLAPKTTGVVEVDAGKSLELNEMAFAVAKKVLNPDGIFFSKIFDGQDVNDFIKVLEKSFRQVKRLRPSAVMKHSKEFYILGLNFNAERN